MEVETLRELLKHPGWQVYLDQVENQIYMNFMEMWGLDGTKPESFVKFVELKAKIDQLRDVTYGYELELNADKKDEVNSSFGKRFIRVLKRLIKGD